MPDRVIKICGFTRPDDAAFAAGVGVDWLGLNFWPRSRRVVDLAQAAEVVAAARAAGTRVALVGIFVDQPIEEVTRVVEAIGLDYAQLHGDEPPAYASGLGRRAIKAFALAAPDDLERLDHYDCQAYLVDTPSPGRGGSGELGDWNLARVAARRHRVLLAGGLTPDNVAQAIAEVAPFGVDAASGVESTPGRKDARLVERFTTTARAAFARLAATEDPPPARGGERS
jgi:phosphoribosylanthranilate isomerase